MVEIMGYRGGTGILLKIQPYLNATPAQEMIEEMCTTNSYGISPWNLSSLTDPRDVNSVLK